MDQVNVGDPPPDPLLSGDVEAVVMGLDGDTPPGTPPSGTTATMTSGALWWSALVLGTVLLVLAWVVPTIRQFRGRRVPRLGIAPPRGSGTPWWTWAALGGGIFLMSLASGQLSESVGGGNLAYFAGACAVALLVQTIAIAWHNRQHRDRPEALTGMGAGPAPS